jgi:HlyD family secretion protein
MKNQIKEKLGKIKVNKRALRAAVAIIVVVAGVAIVRGFLSHPHNAIKVSGNIEATEVRLAFRASGKISELLVDEGASLKKGDIVARLDTDELSRVRNEAKAALDSAEYQHKLAADDYGRAEKLYEAGSISTQKRDAAKTTADSAKANVDAARAAFELAETRLGFVELASPLDSYVLVKSAEAGEVVQAGSTIFTIADLSDIWLTAYINEKDLGKVKLNEEAVIMTDSFPGKRYKGRISFISQEAEFTPKQIQTNEERVKLVYRIKIQVENPNLELKPGMPADGYILR